ncbi:MAG: hypothetical protein LBH68_02080 [Bifidobacteriaceae bacterium]|jgi:predicted nucleic acid-binding protein|nr:hypothetical protein [Bifidobacteriaceae bacterium]
MKLLLDTNLLIIPPSQDFVAQHQQDLFYVSALSHAELTEGEFASAPEIRAAASLQAAAARAAFGPGLPFDDAAALAYRAVCLAVTSRRRQLNRRRRVDLLIAATALANGCAVATRNPADFAGLEGIIEIIPVAGPAKDSAA